MGKMRLSEQFKELRAADYFPHRPACDNNGFINVNISTLTGFVENGSIHIGGYTTNIYDALARSYATPNFTLPANKVSYLYIMRVGTDKLKLVVSEANMPNTFYKAKISSFTTNAVGVTGATPASIGTF